MEQLPNHLFELIGQKTFDALSPGEKSELLRYMDEAEYTAMYKAALAGHSLSANSSAPATDSANKTILMERFREKHQKPSILSTPIALWKVAATVFLFGLAFYFISMPSSIKPTDELVLTDTIYIEKEMPVKTVFDTVYITEQQNLSMDNQRREHIAKHSAAETSVALEMPSDNNALNRLTIEEYKLLQKNKKRRNIKDDSLISSIGFVHL